MANYWVFEDVNLFSLICPHKFKAYSSEHEYIYYTKGDYIYFQGDVSSTIYLVNEGKVKIGFIDDAGEEYVTAYLKKGDIFGENILLNETHRKEFAQDVDKTTSLCSVTLHQAEDLVRGNRSFSTSIYKFIGLKLKKIERRYQIMLFRDTRTRIIEFIKELKEDQSSTVLANSEILIQNPYSQSEIAKLVGTSRPTFNIIINELEKEGFLHYQKNKILLKNKLFNVD
ncbi:Crp/Fnr family transcriptional regulator [Flavobacterium branchiophilum]|uniref:Probable transcriptional regulatory protein, Crp/Fnr family n=1 Tax=Flavobacterium branchiophilum (strain FL-15) TaxID=1034807 RepID=G2YZR1_FLABF|nr:Crp/Fnr family transcriptional regulator [Flavobacterium branchiophilum]CCB69164.1 Probable transcriptional regulatory protein, Crp/Fnr family [Flavobacterium branchiophilum FL-15]